MTRRRHEPDPQAIARDVLLHEADLLDGADWDGWLALLAPEFRYWVPLDPEAATPLDAPSLIDEDLTLVRMRLRRYAHTRAFGRERGRSTLHQLGAIRATADGPAIDVVAQQVVHEFHADRLTLFPGLALMLAVFGFNLLGDGLRDALDPRSRT